MAFIRMYGMEGDPGPRPAPKRKSAAAGPRAKASRKRVVRQRRANRGGNVGASKAPGKKQKGGIFPGGSFGAKARDILGQLGSKGLGGLGGIVAGGIPGMGRAAGGGRRSMNVTNVKALRRSLRRVEGFKKLVKRVDKMFPTGAKMTGGHRHSRGHKRGCKCATCR